MQEINKLTQGNIAKSLIALALPIMGTSFVQMAYNMTDMIWIGRIGSKSVAAVGTAGFFTWLAMAFFLIPKIGAEIGVAQSIGRKNIGAAKDYVSHTIQLNIIAGLIYGAALIVFRKPLIGFFNLGDADVIRMAISYLVIVSFGMNFYFMNPVFTGIYNGYGNSSMPFIMNAIGLVLNMILDPLLIFGWGPFPALGVEGAAIATISAQLFVTIAFVFHARLKMPLFEGFTLFQVPDLARMKEIIRLGFPVALQSGLFTVFAMLLARIIAQWGPVPIAVQKVGSQIEAISWMTAGGFSTAIGTFVGQNYGAQKWDRIYKGYFTAMKIVGIIGIGATALLIFGAKPVFTIFIPEKEAVEYGVVYLKILGLSQIFMCVEIATAGAFNGLGKTVPPSIVGILFTGIRVPMAMILSASTSLGLNGIWWTLTITSIIKGIVLASWFILLLYKQPAVRKIKQKKRFC